MHATSRRLGLRLRLIAARHRWLRRLAVLALAATAALLTIGQLRTIDAARASWEQHTAVVVALGDHEPGDVLRTRRTELPAAALPDRAIHQVRSGTRVTQRVSNGEIITEADLAVGRGPAAIAPPGFVVVPIADQVLDGESSLLTIGVDVGVFSDGIELTSNGSIAEVGAGVVFVAVPADDAPAVAAAAQLRVAALVFPASQ